MRAADSPAATASAVVPAPETTRAIITIDGIDGSGKSTLAARLMAALGPRGVLFSVDDFRLPVDWANSVGSELELYYHRRYDLSALDDCLRAFRDGKTGCTVRRFDGAREMLGDESEVHFGRANVAVVEGVFVARLRTAVDALSLFVDIPREEAARRVRVRDFGKGRSLEEIDRRIERRYFPAFERYLAEQQARDRAAILIDNFDPRAPRVMRARLPAGAGWSLVRTAIEGVLAEPH